LTPRVSRRSQRITVVAGGSIVRVLVLGGCGLQGRAVLHDLPKNPRVKEVIAADLKTDGVAGFTRHLNLDVIRFVRADVTDRSALMRLMAGGIDVVIDVLPAALTAAIAEAAVDAGVNAVNTMYSETLPDGLHERALRKGIAIMPEAGLDPGIDLVLSGYGAGQLDEVSALHSYCGGFPERAAAGNPLQYKISWTWNGVLLSYKRPARIIKDGAIVTIPAEDQHDARWIGTIDFPGVGPLELIPNGDAVSFAASLGLGRTLRDTTRCTMRWPGHAALWRPWIALKFLSDEPVKGLPFDLTPHQFMVKHLEPQLQYRDDERDIVAMRVVVEGRRDGRAMRITYDMLDTRDLQTGLFAMNRTTGFSVSVIGQMVGGGDISRKGLLTPLRDVPYRRFIDELSRRGITIGEKIEFIN
jgi:saccharopine dehydrogenase-like NADP-dependent oxidoreductase